MRRTRGLVFAVIFALWPVSEAAASYRGPASRQEASDSPQAPEQELSGAAPDSRPQPAGPRWYRTDARHAEEDRASSTDELVEQRLRDNLTREMLEHFDLFLYVSKASAGAWAQRMYVFQKQRSGDFYLLYNWPVSTGREGSERNAAGQELTTSTPAGYYKLDPSRFYPQYRSSQWGESMPNAMFLKWVDHGAPTGLAIHAATGDNVNALGTRASAGCIRLAPENARVLYNLIHDSYQGMAPALAFDESSGTIMNNGQLEHDANGSLRLEKGYRVLLFIDEYGGESLEAALY